MTSRMGHEAGMPAVVDRATFQSESGSVAASRESHTRREGDAIAALRRRLPMVAVDGTTRLIGGHGPVTLLDAFEGRRMLIAYYCHRSTWSSCAGAVRGLHPGSRRKVRELSYLHSRDVTYAVLCQGPYDESARYRDFMGWEMPWYSAENSLDTLLVGRQVGLFHLVCYLRHGSDVFETYWTTGRGVEAMDSSYDLLDMTIYGRQEMWEDSPAGWLRRFRGKQNIRTDGRPTAQWSRLEAGYSDDLRTGRR